MFLGKYICFHWQLGFFSMCVLLIEYLVIYLKSQTHDPSLDIVGKHMVSILNYKITSILDDSVPQNLRPMSAFSASAGRVSSMLQGVK